MATIFKLLLLYTIPSLVGVVLILLVIVLTPWHRFIKPTDMRIVRKPIKSNKS